MGQAAWAGGLIVPSRQTLAFAILASLGQQRRSIGTRNPSDLRNSRRNPKTKGG
jgi:hypothetical protein